jgi:hypothetical protein
MNPWYDKLLTLDENDHTIDGRPSRETFPEVKRSALSVVRRSKLYDSSQSKNVLSRGALERVASFALLLGTKEVWGHFLFVDSQKRYLHRQPVCRLSACAQGPDNRSASARLFHSHGQPQRPGETGPTSCRRESLLRSPCCGSRGTRSGFDRLLLRTGGLGDRYSSESPQPAADPANCSGAGRPTAR